LQRTVQRKRFPLDFWKEAQGRSVRRQSSGGRFVRGSDQW
jgi:hypothetical protein